jgi:AraC-like DNA-binding protein
LVKEIKPADFLSGHIRLFRIIDFHFPDEIIIPPKVYPPRPEQCIQFYPKDTETVTYPNSKLIVANKKTTLTGQHTMVNHRQVGREFLSVQVIFHPGAFHRLTGIPMNELSNMYLDAAEVLGTETEFINEQLYFAGGHGEMIIVLEEYLKKLIKRSKKPADNVDWVLSGMLSDEQYRIDYFIKTAYLSHRQFDRKFKERVGISPKQFLQIIRFERAFGMKNSHTEKDWLSIALHCGYYDYQHLVKDYKEFTGSTPTQFFEIDNRAPEYILQQRRPQA